MAFHILNQFDIPNGSVINSSVGKPAAETTEWTAVSDLKNLRWYFRTYQGQAIRMVDLKEIIAAASGEIRTIYMEQSTQSDDNVSTELKSLKQQGG